jgi:hypothetical protein
VLGAISVLSSLLDDPPICVIESADLVAEMCSSTGCPGYVPLLDVFNSAQSGAVTHDLVSCTLPCPCHSASLSLSHERFALFFFFGFLSLK